MRVAAFAAVLWLAAAPPVVHAQAGPTAGADALHAGAGPGPAAGSPFLAYAALGVSGLALILGAAAVAAALAARRRADEVAEALRTKPAAPLDPRSADRLSRLEAAVRDLAAAPAPARRPPQDSHPSPREPFPPSASSRPAPGSAPVTAPVSAPASAPASAPGAPPAERLSAWVEELKARFAGLALDPSAAAAGFIADHAPRGALAGPGGVALLDGFEGAKLWAVRAPGETEVWALTPGEQAVLNWSAHFAAQRTRVAAEVFGEAFDLVEGGAGLRLEEPALARRDVSGRLSVRRRGRLSGFRG